ncbi:hypothetical protein A2U01_0114685, partial [Trifolium medium]|nr:hypothetical protein [Trifolium medium]
MFNTGTGREKPDVLATVDVLRSLTSVARWP